MLDSRFIVPGSGTCSFHWTSVDFYVYCWTLMFVIGCL